MKGKALTIAGLCALAVALALPTGGLAAQPTSTSLKGDYSGTFSICGLDLTYDHKISGFEMIRSDGLDLVSGESRTVWANPATGKAIVLHSAGHSSDSLVDNGDGTSTDINTYDGMNNVSEANGPPISLHGGRVTFKLTFDSVTGDIISVETLVDNGHSAGPDTDSCDTLVAALT